MIKHECVVAAALACPYHTAWPSLSILPPTPQTHLGVSKAWHHSNKLARSRGLACPNNFVLIADLVVSNSKINYI